jgi:hypothetical protein
LKGENLINPAGMAMDIRSGKDNQNQDVVPWTRHNGKNQQWKIEYFGGSGIKKIS